MYKTGPNGLIGNDDCGQMSAWYIWTSLGMYPMNPANGEYIFGYPLVKQATLRLPGKKRLQIQTVTVNNKGKGIASVVFNGKKIPVHSITHRQLLQGGKLIFYVYR